MGPDTPDCGFLPGIGCRLQLHFLISLNFPALCTGEDPRGRKVEVMLTMTQFGNVSEAFNV